MAVTVDAVGSAYVTGGTTSRDFRHPGGRSDHLRWYRRQLVSAIFAQPSGDRFVAKLSPSGSALVYSSYLGGGGVDHR